MCQLLKDLTVMPLKHHAKVENKLSAISPIASTVEKETGWRPWTSTQMAAKHLKVDTGRRKNQYYKPGARGNPYG
ncbi:hypothetical protein [Microbulbifer discodermiae]|uniref:hypothetical protein n=1 Tax=Microbulbifer sp. 2201CG32-9 TaxID=3232309 RepID=UPI00345BC172